METSLNKSQSSIHKVKNILLRYKSFSDVSCSKEYEYPENLFLLRYFPKYYKSLKLKITNQNPLLSKIKKIKRLKKIKSLQWASEKGSFRTNWMTFFENCRKDIEEIPEIPPLKPKPKSMRFFCTKLSLQEAKFFDQIPKHLLSIGDTSGRESNFTRLEILVIEKAVFKYLRNIKRSQRILEIIADRYNCDELKYILEKLEKRSDSGQFFRTLRIDLSEKRAPFCHWQNPIFLRDRSGFEPRLSPIIQILHENLRSLSIDFGCFYTTSPEFPGFLLSLQNLPKLETLGFYFAEDMTRFLPYIRPPANLRNLSISFKNNEIWKNRRDVSSCKNLVEHWEDLKELENLEFSVICNDNKGIYFPPVFVTMVLKKVFRLTSFIFWLDLGENLVGSYSIHQPFFVEQVPHLYDCLQEFRAELFNRAYLARPALDLKLLKSFKNLRKIKVGGEWVCLNMKDTIDLYEEDGKYMKLSGKLGVKSEDELQEMFERISQVEKSERNLKIKLSFVFDTTSEEVLEEIWRMINSVKFKRNLMLHGDFFLGSVPRSVEKIREILGKYREMPNCVFQMVGASEVLNYIKVNGGKEILFEKLSQKMNILSFDVKSDF